MAQGKRRSRVLHHDVNHSRVAALRAPAQLIWFHTFASVDHFSVMLAAPSRLLREFLSVCWAANEYTHADLEAGIEQLVECGAWVPFDGPDGRYAFVRKVITSQSHGRGRGRWSPKAERWSWGAIPPWGLCDDSDDVLTQNEVDGCIKGSIDADQRASKPSLVNLTRAQTAALRAEREREQEQEREQERERERELPPSGGAGGGDFERRMGAIRVAWTAFHEDDLKIPVVWRPAEQSAAKEVAGQAALDRFDLRAEIAAWHAYCVRKDLTFSLRGALGNLGKAQATAPKPQAVDPYAHTEDPRWDYDPATHGTAEDGKAALANGEGARSDDRPPPPPETPAETIAPHSAPQRVTEGGQKSTTSRKRPSKEGAKPEGRRPPTDEERERSVQERIAEQKRRLAEHTGEVS